VEVRRKQIIATEKKLHRKVADGTKARRATWGMVKDNGVERT